MVVRLTLGIACAASAGYAEQGRKDLRAALVEAAWITIRFDQRWLAQFERLADRIGRHKAIVATPAPLALPARASVARKPLVVIRHVLSKRQVGRQADPERVVRYFLAWGRQTKVFARLGLKASEFARQQLNVLGIGQELSRITFGVTYCLPPSTLPVAEPVATPA